jgi:hypothetical protein
LFRRGGAHVGVGVVAVLVVRGIPRGRLTRGHHDVIAGAEAIAVVVPAVSCEKVIDVLDHHADLGQGRRAENNRVRREGLEAIHPRRWEVVAARVSELLKLDGESRSTVGRDGDGDLAL